MPAPVLITPLSSEFLKDFPGQNAINMDRIDVAAGNCLPGNALSSYVPILTAGTTNPDIGGGTVRGNFFLFFDWVFVFAEFRFGASLSAGSGVYIMSLPFTLDTNITPSGTATGSQGGIGNGTVWDNTAANRQPVVVTPRTNSTVQFCTHFNATQGGRAVDNTGPITWASGTGITWSGRYKRLT